jgi:hypothetical protein
MDVLIENGILIDVIVRSSTGFLIRWPRVKIPHGPPKKSRVFGIYAESPFSYLAKSRQIKGILCTNRAHFSLHFIFLFL